ncbi:MAG: hypothetical protein IT340_15100 [Chloroflexi bacterium]|nr:hypothetical protein [Chloroflexota bacterium]
MIIAFCCLSVSRLGDRSGAITGARPALGEAAFATAWATGQAVAKVLAPDPAG